MMASSSIVRTVDLGSFGPVRASQTDERFFHLAIVFWLTPKAYSAASGSINILYVMGAAARAMEKSELKAA